MGIKEKCKKDKKTSEELRLLLLIQRGRVIRRKKLRERKREIKEKR